MLDRIKQIDKKFLIIGGVVVGFIILLIILMVVIKLLSGPGTNYSKLEDKLITAAKNYMKENSELIPLEGEQVVLDSSTLISEGKIKELDKYVEDECTATVTVMNNGGQSLYLPNLTCTGYQTLQLKTKIIDDQLVIDAENPYEGGLYEVDGEYIFKGKNVNNYVSFGGLTWRIVKIDENGNLRLIKASAEKAKKMWDNKYNVDEKKTYGINDYENSYIRETLIASYEGVTDKNKAHIIPQDVCVGKRSSSDMSISYDIDCSEILSGDYISVINTLDFAMASLDENCTVVGAGACTNYNYLYNTISSSWTTIGSADNSYEVYNISGGYVSTLKAKNSVNYNWVIYVSGEELYTSGDGSESNPYVIG